MGELLRMLVIERGDATWIDGIVSLKKKYKNTKDSSSKLTPNQASFKKMEIMFTKKH